MAAAKFFSPDYTTARARFRAAALRAGARLEALSVAGAGPAGEDLTIDIAWLGSRRPDRVTLHSSGLHGLEGFTGSAVQLAALAAPPTLPTGTALALVHALNPWGMAWLRRPDEANIDLNRNCLLDGKIPPTPPLYAAIDPLLSPPSPPRWDGFLPRMGWALLARRQAFYAMTQVVAGGQYTHPRGLFFGGTEMRPALHAFFQWAVERCSAATRIAALDVHTGLGWFGADMLFPEHPEDAAKRARLSACYGRGLVWPQAGSAVYQTSGSYVAALETLFADQRCDAVLQEFGTYPKPYILKALRAENRCHHYAGGPADHPAKRAALAIFNPPFGWWRRRVVRLGLERLQETFALLASA